MVGPVRRTCPCRGEIWQSCHWWGSSWRSPRGCSFCWLAGLWFWLSTQVYSLFQKVGLFTVELYHYCLDQRTEFRDVSKNPCLGPSLFWGSLALFVWPCPTWFLLCFPHFCFRLSGWTNIGSHGLELEMICKKVWGGVRIQLIILKSLASLLWEIFLLTWN